MKNNPESVLKKMFTSIGRSWSNLSHTHVNSFGPNYIIPDLVMPITGNTTVRMKINSYILSQPTPTPVFDSMRVDVQVFLAPQRLYTRGLIGDNFLESKQIEEFSIPHVTINRKRVSTPTGQSLYYGAACLPGSLLHRLGFPTFMHTNNVLRGLYDVRGPESTISDQDGALILPLYNNSSGTSVGLSSQQFNMSTVVAYYDICRYFLSNLMTDLVPISRYKSFGFTFGNTYAEDKADYDYTPVSGWQSLGSIGEFINEVRGVVDITTGGSSSIRSWANMFQSTTNSGSNLFQLYFNGFRLLDEFKLTDTQNVGWRRVANAMRNIISDTGLWPARYEDHFQTMYFDSDKVDNLMAVSWDSDVQSFRLGQTEFTTKLKRLLRGMRWKNWVEITFGSRVPMDDKPIKIGSDTYFITFEDIVNRSATGSVEYPLGSSAGRGIGGNKSALRQSEEDVKEYSFTTLEPCYLFVMYSVVPRISYAAVLPRHLRWTKFGDFPLPQNSGKTFEPLKGEDFYCTLTSKDQSRVGEQPIYFDNFKTYNRLGGVFATDLRNGYTFKRDFDFERTGSGLTNYLASTYVEPGVFDWNFEDQGVNGRQNFSVKTAYEISLCQPLQKVVTEYDI